MFDRGTEDKETIYHDILDLCLLLNDHIVYPMSSIVRVTVTSPSSRQGNASLITIP